MSPLLLSNIHPHILLFSNCLFVAKICFIIAKFNTISISKSAGLIRFQLSHSQLLVPGTRTREQQECYISIVDYPVTLRNNQPPTRPKILLIPALVCMQIQFKRHPYLWPPAEAPTKRYKQPCVPWAGLWTDGSNNKWSKDGMRCETMTVEWASESSFHFSALLLFIPPCTMPRHLRSK